MLIEVCVRCGREAPSEWVDPPESLEEAISRHKEDSGCPGGCVWGLKEKYDGKEKNIYTYNEKEKT